MKGQLTRVPVLGAADGVQVLLLGCHGGCLQRLCVALQRAQLLPLAVHVVLMPLQVGRLEGQRDRTARNEYNTTINNTANNTNYNNDDND